MNGETGGALSLIVGAVLVRLSVTGAHRRYVKAAMGPWVTLAGVVLIVLGLVVIVRSLRNDRDTPTDTDDDRHEHGQEHGHEHGHEPSHEQHHEHAHSHAHSHGGERIAWLLVAPVLTLLLVAPPALGAFALTRGAARASTSGRSNWPPLTPGAAPIPIPLADFYQRAYGGGEAVFNGAKVQVTGFVAQTSGDGFLIARYAIACCAADASASVARVVGYAGGVPPRDQWVTVTGTFQSIGTDGPRLVADTVIAIPTPNDPYE